MKRHRSKKESDGTRSWRYEEIRLEPENPEFNPIVLENVPDSEFQVTTESASPHLADSTKMEYTTE